MCERILRVRPCGRIHSAYLKRCEKYVQKPGKRCNFDPVVATQTAVLGCCRECTKIYAEALHLPKKLNLEFADGVEYMDLDTYRYVAALPRPPLEEKEERVTYFEVLWGFERQTAHPGDAATSPSDANPASAGASSSGADPAPADRVRTESVSMTDQEASSWRQSTTWSEEESSCL